ncbi:MAG: class I SAM-dependent methyltransferase [Patescibacteria group bacterium]|nr:class I SAM-dependent methyltransferase [Patescibacteria group bacterium]
MRISIINYLACPVCRGDFLLSTHEKTKERVIGGKLKCKKCSKSFYIENGIACFVCLDRKITEDTKKLRRITIKQEIPKTWTKLFSKEEYTALRKEWDWMLSVVEKNKNAVHLDFATGTGRFLRNIVSKTNGEIIALDFSYSTCQELIYFLKKIKKYRRVSVICADAHKMPFKNGVFNSVSSWAGLAEPRMEGVIKEARRVLKRMAYLTASGLHYQKDSRSFLLAKKNYINFVTKKAIIQTLKKANFRNIEHKVFFRGKWNEKESYLPILGDSYSTFAIRAQK